MICNKKFTFGILQMFVPFSVVNGGYTKHHMPGTEKLNVGNEQVLLQSEQKYHPNTEV